MREKTKREERIVKSGRNWREKAVLLETNRGAKYLNIQEEQFLTPEEERYLTTVLTLYSFDIHKQLLYAHFNFLPYSIYIQEARTKVDYFVVSIINQLELLKGITSVYIIGENLREILDKKEYTKLRNKINTDLKNKKTNYSLNSENEYKTEAKLVLESIQEILKKFIDFLRYTKELYVFSEYYFENFLPLPIYSNYLKAQKEEVIFNTVYIQSILKGQKRIPSEYDFLLPNFEDIETPPINPEIVERISKEFK